MAIKRDIAEKLMSGKGNLIAAAVTWQWSAVKNPNGTRHGRAQNLKLRMSIKR